jgi:myo-inositol 2-dehydrogenase / D-chiro-inositol 1-dehydrogenase
VALPRGQPLLPSIASAQKEKWKKHEELLNMWDSYTIAVIGAGDMGGRHVHGWQSLGHRVLSITDVDADRAHQLAEQYGVEQVHTDLDTAIADEAVDIVSICLPLSLHTATTVKAAQHGKHVFCEKPLAPSLADAAAMERAVTEAGVIFGLGMQRNLAAGVGLLRDWAAEGRFGRPMVFNSDLLQEVRPKIAMHDRNGNNGPLTDAGCHYYLLWETVFRSRPTIVYAQGRILAAGRPEVALHRQLAIDTAVVTMAFESGDVATMTVSWGLAKSFAMPGRADRVFGPVGGAEGSVQSELTLYTGSDTETITMEEQDLHAVEFDDFARAIRTGCQPAAGFTQGRELIMITKAIEESIASGQPVRVPHD